MTNLIQVVVVVLHAALCVGGMWCTLCRLNFMHKATRNGVTAEYFILGGACALLLFANTSPWVFLLLALILLRFSLTSPRWLKPLPEWSLKKTL